MFKLPYLNDTLYFPPVEHAHSCGLLAAGGDLSVHRLILAYSSGIFPWFDENDPYLWWSPDPRFVLFVDKFHLSKRQERAIRNSHFLITANKAFDKVIEHCATIPRNIKPNVENMKGEGIQEGSTEKQDTQKQGTQEQGSWITNDMIHAYKELFDEGFAHSVEVWQKPIKHSAKESKHQKTALYMGTTESIHQEEYQLVGGLYGVRIGQVFCGESMFHIVPEASRAALAFLISAMKKHQMPLLDSQQKTAHMERLGAQEISRSQFLQILKKGLLTQGTGHRQDFLNN